MKILAYHPATLDWLVRFPDDFPDAEWALASNPSDVARELPGSEILILANSGCTPELGEIVRRNGDRLKWMHFITAGMERGVAMGLPENVLISHAPGIRANMVAEHAMALLLALVRRLPEIGREQRAHRWSREHISENMGTLEGKTVCIVGLGNIGREVARKLRAFHARPIGVSRKGEAGDEVADVYPRTAIAAAFAQSDAVVVCTMADEGSRRLVSAAALAALKPDALLVNVARGSLVDEKALIAALREGRLGGAGLDVQETEPLPADSPLWDMPNVIISPHSAGTGSSSYIPHRALFAENLARYRSGKPLIHAYRPTGRQTT
jgi:phosphoglycerate dehydrogenase-like enzyme